MADELEIRIDVDACRGAGECAYRAPRTFAVGANDRAKLIDPEADELEVVLAAARCCPNFAIAVLRQHKRVV
jgi:ferredoxin